MKKVLTTKISGDNIQLRCETSQQIKQVGGEQMKKKIEMTRQEYRKSLERFGEIKTPEEARAFHKEMRCYKNAPRVPLFRRYPEIPDKVSIAVLVMEIVTIICMVLLK